jgi:hypothetical protein
MAASDMQERWGRETRMLVLVVVVSIAVLLVLARFRYPAPNLTVAPAAQGPLAGLAGRSAFDDLGSSLTTLLTRVTPRLSAIRVKGEPPEPPRAAGRRAAAEPAPAISLVMPAVRMRSDIGLIFMPAGATMAEGDAGTPIEVAASDPAREVGLVRLAPAEPMPDTPVTFGGFAYIGAVTATPSGLTIAPIFVGRADRAVDPLWGGVVYMIDSSADLHIGAFAFTMEGNFVGLVAKGSAGTVIVPGPTLAGVTTELLRPGTSPS